ncbi:DUF305 domain-containing protein [Micromonospora carbonacea]|uniref:DUF305 domain-containing protein n=1 Tax=Micromonospora carbonacea TaxID=47853 RepID=UPI003D70BA1C
MTNSATMEPGYEEVAVAESVHPGNRGRFGPLALTAILVIGLLLGYAGGILAPLLTRPSDSSPEAGFARDMTAHHAQAVEMSLTAYRSATIPAVRQMAVDIATGQQGEIGAMQTWLRQWDLSPSRSGPPMAWMPDGAKAVTNGLMPGMANPAQMAALRDARGADVDRQFLKLMIDHHLGGIHMIDGILKATDEPEVARVANTMKSTQQNELNSLRDLLAQAQP